MDPLYSAMQMWCVSTYLQLQQSVTMLSGRMACSPQNVHLLPAAFVLVFLRLPECLFLEPDLDQNLSPNSALY